MVVETTLRSVALLLVAVFAIAGWHKVRTVLHGEAAQQPILARFRLTRAVAAAVLVVAIVVEWSLMGVLVAWPGAGFSATTVLLLVYSAVLLRLAPDGGCMCLGEFLDAGSRSGSLRRNAALTAAAAGGAVLTVGFGVDVGPISEASVGVTLIAGFPLTARAVLRRNQSTAVPTRPKEVDARAYQ
jgi:hypothetical protein